MAKTQSQNRSLSLEYVPVDEVKRWPRNPKEHDLGALHQSFGRFGFVNPLIINEATGELLAGHGRLDALAQCQIEGQAPPEGVRQENGHWLVPVVRGITLTEKEAEAYSIADNRLVELGGWNEAELVEVLKGLDSFDGVGYDADDLDALIAGLEYPKQGLTNDDAIPEEAPIVCKTGDLWQLGEHRLLCGDATVITDVEKLMQEKKADMVLTDPPYGIDYKYGNHLSGNYTDKFTKKEYSEFYCKLVNIGKQSAKANAPYYWWFDQIRLEEVWYAIGQTTYKELLVWGKDFYPYKKGKAKFCADYELCYYFWDDEPYWAGDAFTRAILSYATVHSFARKDKEDTGGVSSVHPTQKPTELFGRLIQLSSRLNNMILDLCGGSGSTLIACEKLGRRCYMMEIDPHYCDVIIKRWENFTGKKAVRLECPL